jgi:hypothetical protein
MPDPFLVRARRRSVREVRRTLRLGVQCNLCGWTGARFQGDNWHPGTICPNCLSQVRHRLLAATLRRPSDLDFAHLVDGKRVLHFAPEMSLTHLVRPRAAFYRTADLYAKPGQGVDLALDITHMPEIGNGEYDLAIACDILEHVSDDGAARSELYRILRPGGYAILTVPQKDGLAETFDDPGAVTPQQREATFGQQDHVRIFGDSFGRLLSEAGFAVSVIDEHSFSRSDVRFFVLAPPILSSHPLATNHRRLFFARTAPHASRTHG